jgi:26S proteasome regulatory subunit N1
MASLKELKTIVRSATTALTSVPKPFKFLKTHYASLTAQYDKLPDSDQKVHSSITQAEFADFLSVISMIFGEKGARTSLYYLLKGTNKDFTEWGHEYVSNLASDLGSEYEIRMENNEPYDELLAIVDKIVPYFVVNNAEHDAIDLLLIVDKSEDIKGYVTEQNFSKVYMYLSGVCGYSSDQDELVKILTIMYDLSLKL